MPRWFVVSLLVLSSLGASSGDALAQRELVALGVAEARQVGDEAALVHMAGQIGPAGIAECLQHAGRSGRLICVQAARYLEQPWPVLAVLASVLRDHDRQVASRAAESLLVILGSMELGDLGAQEPLAEEVELLLEGLRELSSSEQISLDIRAQVILIFGALGRLFGASLDVPRRALGESEVALRRAATAVLVGSQDADDLAALLALLETERDEVVLTQALAALCEATLAAGAPLPASATERIRQLLGAERPRPTLLLPLMICLRRGDAAPLRELFERHPSEPLRRAWQGLAEGEGR